MRINPTVVGIALIVLGMVAFAYQGITYTSRETVLDIGPIHATADTQKTIPLSPLLGGLVLVGGIVLVVVGAEEVILVAVRGACYVRCRSQSDRGSISKELDRGKLTW